MRTGCYGAIANAAYSLGRVLRKRGFDAEYVRDPADLYPMSQPLWEEIELTIDAARLPNDPPDADEWRQIAQRHNYRDPPWVVEAPPARLRELDRRSLLRAARLAARRPNLRRELHQYLVGRSGLIRQMGRYDWLVVCGVGVVDAYFSGRPYLYWPNGGELRLLPFRSETASERFFARAMRMAIQGASVTGTHDPSLADCFDAVATGSVPYLPFLIDTDRWSPGSSRNVPCHEVRDRAGDRRVLFQAARQDFFWKGTDRFMRAFTRAVEEGARLFLVVSPWGNDAPAVRSMVAERGVEDSVMFLEGIPSKPLLARLYRQADVVVDQFALGVHGSTMLEAMACATPVLISLDVGRFIARWPEYVPPPVINATTEDDIYSALLAIARGSIALGPLGEEARRWVLAHHGESQAERFLPGSAP